MCGIHLSVWHDACCSGCQELQERLNEQYDDSNLARRGPDAQNRIKLLLPAVNFREQSPSNGTSATENSSCTIFLEASVLQMRRDLVKQPLAIPIVDKETYHLCWNGEVYQTIEEGDECKAGNFETSDTQLVANKLAAALATADMGVDEDIQVLASHVATVMSSLYNAEYAFLLLRSTDGTICYGRDCWGRRSLLRWDCLTCHSFQIASSAPYMLSKTQGTARDSRQHVDWIEIPPGIIHSTRLNQASTFEPVVVPSLEIPPAKTLSLPDLPAGIPPAGISNEDWKVAQELEYHLSLAVQRRMGHHQHPTAILFSGGLDSSVVAALAAHHSLNDLYLYNVSFGATYEKSADRQAALITHQTLQEQYPNKKIIFQDIVVDWEDICKHEPHIRTILQPKETLMDINIATALWFASGGGSVNVPNIENDRPRVLLLGMGADELMGGYGRHRKAFENGGWEELRQELEMDQCRFWERNLGRDDRIVADHGMEARFPFLDYHVTQYLKGVSLSLICDFSLPPGQGDKRILRLVAKRLRLDHASGLVKRAIQFGSRISHLSDAKRFGSRRKAKGEATVEAPV